MVCLVCLHRRRSVDAFSKDKSASVEGAAIQVGTSCGDSCLCHNFADTCVATSRLREQSAQKICLCAPRRQVCHPVRYRCWQSANVRRSMTLSLTKDLSFALHKMEEVSTDGGACICLYMFATRVAAFGKTAFVCATSRPLKAPNKATPA